MMNVGLHMRVLGHQGRAGFLNCAGIKADVWICKRKDIVRRWVTEHPCEIAS